MKGDTVSRLGCKCGETLSWVSCPSENIIHVWHKTDVDNKLTDRPLVTALDFYSEDSEFGYEYWYCTECKRIMVVNVKTSRIRYIYKKSCTLDVLSDISNWHDQIYYINDIDLDRLTDENIDLTLRDLINEYVKTFFVSPDLKKVCSMDEDGTYSVKYELEEIIPLKQ